VTALTFSFMAGIFHAYYTVALAPAIAALVGIGAWVLWDHRSSLVATGLMSFTVALTSMFAWCLLDRSTGQPADERHQVHTRRRTGRGRAQN
jgi:4-amino-4-deoxy-L-arabinose transferase-like glycosyltransferase